MLFLESIYRLCSNTSNCGPRQFVTRGHFVFFTIMKTFVHNSSFLHLQMQLECEEEWERMIAIERMISIVEDYCPEIPC